MPPSDSKTKIRPQQSCLKCRERKVKCDRSVPCHACIIRGLEAECIYLTTAEDRAHISQAEIIERLRHEVAQLRGQLNRSPRDPSPSSRFGARYARAYTGNNQSTGYSAGTGAEYVAPTAFSAGGNPKQAEGSWPGSSPSSSATTLTSSVTVTSPDSTGSDGGMNQPQVSSSAYAASMGPYGTRIAEVDGSAMGGEPAAVLGGSLMDDATVSQCHAGGMGVAPGEITVSTPMHGIPSHSVQHPEGVPSLSHYSVNTDRDESPNYAVDDGSVTHPNLPIHDNYTKLYEQRYPSTEGDERSHTYHGQWRADASGNRFPPVHQYPESSYYPSTVGAYTNSDPSSHHPLYQPAPIAQAAPPNAFHQETFTENPANTIPSSWKGKGKQELLETLLETIGGCDEDRVAQVIQVVRMSATPEEAVAGICQVLGIPGRR